MVNGAYELRASPRLCDLRAKDVIFTAGLEEPQEAKACVGLRGPTIGEPLGMVVLHVGEACFLVNEPRWDKSFAYIRSQFTLGHTEYGTFICLGRPFHPIYDFTMELRHAEYVHAFGVAFISKQRRAQARHTRTDKAKPDYRHLVGQLVWPARETMPPLSYSVSDLPQNVETATVGNLPHANNGLSIAKKGLSVGQQLKLLHLDISIYLNVSLTDNPNSRQVVIDTSEKYRLFWHGYRPWRVLHGPAGRCAPASACYLMGNTGQIRRSMSYPSTGLGLVQNTPEYAIYLGVQQQLGCKSI